MVFYFRIDKISCFAQNCLVFLVFDSISNLGKSILIHFPSNQKLNAHQNYHKIYLFRKIKIYLHEQICIKILTNFSKKIDTILYEYEIFFK
jgi:hypothetical protein